MDRYSWNLGVVWVFLNNKPAFLKDPWLHYIQQGIFQLPSNLWNRTGMSSLARYSSQRKFEM